MKKKEKEKGKKKKKKKKKKTKKKKADGNFMIFKKYKSTKSIKPCLLKVPEGQMMC